MGTHPIFESDFDCLTVVSNSNSKMSASSGPNIQLELRLAEMARMNEEIRRRHLEVEADKRRAQREGTMVSRDQSITMATVMPTDFDTSREDGFKDGLDSRPLPADPYGKDRVPRDKRGKPQDKMNKQANKKRQQTIDEARQRGMNDQDYWRQEQARADAARIKRAQGRDGTWRREWDREKNHSDERNDMSGFRSKRDKQYNRRSGDKDQMSRGQGGQGGGARYQRDRNRRNKQFDQGPPQGGQGGRVRRQSNEDYQRRDYGDQSRQQQQQQQQRGQRYSARKNKQNDRKSNRTSRSSPPPNHRPKSGELEREKSSDELNEYSSDEARLRRRSSGSETDSDMMGPKVPDNLGEEVDDYEAAEHDIELPPSIESNQSRSSDDEDDIAKSLASAMAKQTLDSQDNIEERDGKESEAETLEQQEATEKATETAEETPQATIVSEAVESPAVEEPKNEGEKPEEKSEE